MDNHEATEKLHMAVQHLRDTLRIKDDVPHRNAEKESTTAALLMPSYVRRKTSFNNVVKDPRFLAREAEWSAMSLDREVAYSTLPSFACQLVPTYPLC